MEFNHWFYAMYVLKALVFTMQGETPYVMLVTFNSYYYQTYVTKEGQQHFNFVVGKHYIPLGSQELCLLTLLSYALRFIIKKLSQSRVSRRGHYHFREREGQGSWVGVPFPDYD